MSANPFNRNTVREPRLGAIISDEPGTHDRRDAVHNAVVPLKATCALKPGQRIGITADEEHADPNATALGIVDPFLTADVEPGQRFWLFIFPGQVTTLRHEWTHPAFRAEPAPLSTITADDHIAKSKAKIAAIADAIEIHPKELMRAAENWIECNDYTVQHGTETWRYEFPAHAKEFWHHYRVLTGKGPKNDEDSFFCCTC